MESRDPARNPLRRACSGAAPDPSDVTLLFCDVVRSTELTERLGDRAAYAVIRRFHALVERCVDRSLGEPLEVRGDGVLIAFDEPRHGLGCAIAIQRRLAGQQRERLAVRVGLHTGQALRVGVGYFGKAVILSARIAASAEPGEILASGQLRERVRESAAFRFDRERWLALKGFVHPSRVFAVAWRRETEIGREPHPASRVRLRSTPADRRDASTRQSGILADHWQAPA
jgi:adenylate cyclase